MTENLYCREFEVVSKSIKEANCLNRFSVILQLPFEELKINQKCQTQNSFLTIQKIL